jgi:hypothetical protein
LSTFSWAAGTDTAVMTAMSETNVRRCFMRRFYPCGEDCSRQAD